MRISQLIEMQKYSPFVSDKSIDFYIQEFFSNDDIKNIEVDNSKKRYIAIIIGLSLFAVGSYFLYSKYKKTEKEIDGNKS